MSLFKWIKVTPGLSEAILHKVHRRGWEIKKNLRYGLTH